MSSCRRTANRPLATISLAVLLTGIASVASAQPTTITIQASQPGKSISPDLFGVFFEDLNYAADGGLYAELIQNRSFEFSPTEQSDWHPLRFWDLQKRGGGDGTVGVASMRPIHHNNPHYALLTVRTPGEGVGIANPGEGALMPRGGEFGIKGRLPRTTHGGLLSYGHCGTGGAMAHVVETHLQMTGRAGARQVREASLALMHGDGGILSSHVSMFVERVR